MVTDKNMGDIAVGLGGVKGASLGGNTEKQEGSAP